MTEMCFSFPLRQVCTSGSLIVDFSMEEKPRVISWYFQIKDHLEYVPRSCLGSLVSLESLGPCSGAGERGGVGEWGERRRGLRE